MFDATKSIKRIISISAAAVCMLGSLRVAPADYFESVDAASTLTAFQITQNMKVGWNLGNTLDAYAQDADGNPLASCGVETETCWKNPKANQTLFNALKAKGFNTVRIPTTWFQHLDSDNKIDPAWLARVHEVVDYAYKNNMHVILNVHHEEGWINRPDLATAYDDIKPRLMAIWTQVAEEFKDYDQHLIFECMNEPRAKGTDHEWWSASPVAEADVINKLNADFVKLIRSTDGAYAKNRLLMLPGYVASSDKTFLNQIVMPDDDYCAVSIHAYTPYNFTMNTNTEEGAYHDTFTKEFSADLAYNLQNFRDMFVNKGIPVVIGEMGTSNFGNTQARVDWTKQYFETTKKYGIPCVLWDNNIESNPAAPGECHGYINRETGEWLSSSLPIINKMMEIMDDPTIVWGSEGKMPTYDHQDINSGKAYISSPIEIDASKSDVYQNTTPGEPEVTWADMKGKEVAIKYTGDTPVLAVSDKDYKGWKEMSPYTIDEEKGIAYYLVDQAVPKIWEGSLDNIRHMQARTNAVTKIEKIVFLNAPDIDIEIEVDKTKKYSIELGSNRNGNITINLKGDAGTATNGCLGFKAPAWTQVEWETTIGSDGTAKVVIPLDKVPADATDVEFQIWYNPEKVEMKDYTVDEKQTETETQSETTSEQITTGTLPDVQVTKYGDANLDNVVNIADAVLVMQVATNPDKYAVGKSSVSIKPVGEANADVDGKKGLTNSDALLIQQHKLGLITRFPVESK